MAAEYNIEFLNFRKKYAGKLATVKILNKFGDAYIYFDSAKPEISLDAKEKLGQFVHGYLELVPKPHLGDKDDPFYAGMSMVWQLKPRVSLVRGSRTVAVLPPAPPAALSGAGAPAPSVPTISVPTSIRRELKCSKEQTDLCRRQNKVCDVRTGTCVQPLSTGKDIFKRERDPLFKSGTYSEAEGRKVDVANGLHGIQSEIEEQMRQWSAAIDRLTVEEVTARVGGLRLDESRSGETGIEARFGKMRLRDSESDMRRAIESGYGGGAAAGPKGDVPDESLDWALGREVPRAREYIGGGAAVESRESRMPAVLEPVEDLSASRRQVIDKLRSSVSITMRSGDVDAARKRLFDKLQTCLSDR